MDAPSRNLFYDTIIDRRKVTGRTFILSTHLVSESAYLFDHVLILDNGRLVVDESHDGLIERGGAVAGLLDMVQGDLARARSHHMGAA